MSGVAKTIFGEGPKIETQAPVPVRKELKYTPEQEQLLSTILGYITPAIGQPGTAYPGQMVAGLSPTEQQAMGTLSQYSQRFTSPEEYYSTMIEKPLMEAWQEKIMPAIGGEFGRRGLFYGSGRREAETESAETLMDALAKGRVGAETQTLQNILGMTGTQMEMGGIERGIEQGRLSAEYQDWLRTQPGNIPEMDYAMRLLGLSPYEFIRGENVVYPGRQGLLQQAIAGAGPLAAGLGSLGLKLW